MRRQKQWTKHLMVAAWGLALVARAATAGTPLSTAFSYQGRLQNAGVPVNGNVGFEFRLWDAATLGSQVGDTQAVDGHPVARGLFTVPLDFGADAFPGDARWLEITIQGSAGPTPLTPRQPLAATPYALYALRAPWAGLLGIPGGFLDGIDNDTTYSAGEGLSLIGTEFSVDFAGTGNALFVARSDHDHFGDAWTGSSGTSGLSIANSSTAYSAKALYARASGALGETYGVYGRNDSADGTGVYGSATALSGETYGVYGFSSSDEGCGVYGVASATSGWTSGVYGHCDSRLGSGVYGFASDSSGLAYGVYGRSESTSGRGVYGFAPTNSGKTYGVYGQSNSSGGYGVYGTAPGLGVYGYASAGLGKTRGVYGTSDSAEGHGVHGYATAVGGETTGVYGHSASFGGYGVYGTSPHIGVYGIGTGSTITPVGVWGQAAWPGRAGYFHGTVHVTGDFYVDGNKNFIQQHPTDPTKEIVYVSLEGGESGTYVRGTAELRNGEARVELPEHFALVTNAEGLTVQLTPAGAWLQLYVVDKTPGRIVVREASGKDGQFDYFVQGIRRGHEDHQVIRDRMPRPEPAMPDAQAAGEGAPR